MKKPTTKKSTKRHLNTAELVNVQGGWYVVPLLPQRELPEGERKD